MKIKITALLVGFCGFSTLAFADAKSCAGDSHFHHRLTVNKPATCVVAKLYETESFCLKQDADSDISGQAFTVTPDKPVQFDLVVEGGADFNMEYALTCVQNDGEILKSPKVIFTIGAKGPADPDVSAVSLYGAKAEYSSQGDSEQLTVEF